MSTTTRLPYVTAVLDGLKRRDPDVTAALRDNHMHLGYWPDGQAAGESPGDLSSAGERLTRRVCDIAGIRDGQRVLDAGCGLGGTIASLNERFNEMDLVGVNIDPRQIEHARREIAPRPGNRVEFCEADACSMPLPDGSFDAILAVECIFHFPSRARFFEEARRLLKPGGRLVLTDGLPAEGLAPALDIAHRLGGPYLNRVSGPVDLRGSLPGYEDLGLSHGLPLCGAEDITRNTLPTYPALRRVLSGGGALPSALVRAGVWGMEAASRLGLARYFILSFERR